MLRSLLFCTLAFAAPGLAEFSCPAESTHLERKDDVQWMNACLDTKNRLHGPFEIWSRQAENPKAGKAYQRTTRGQYTHGARTGKWIYWNIDGVKVAEKDFP